jgi:hypothetical protein
MESGKFRVELAVFYWYAGDCAPGRQTGPTSVECGFNRFDTLAYFQQLLNVPPTKDQHSASRATSASLG